MFRFTFPNTRGECVFYQVVSCDLPFYDFYHEPMNYRVGPIKLKYFFMYLPDGSYLTQRLTNERTNEYYDDYDDYDYCY